MTGAEQRKTGAHVPLSTDVKMARQTKQVAAIPPPTIRRIRTFGNSLVLTFLARQRNLWVVIEDICGKYRIHDRGCDVAPAVDKAPAHRASLWTAATRYVTCPPLPDLEPTA